MTRVPGSMTPADLEAFLEEMAWSDTAAANELGVHRNTIRNWLRGETPIPRVMAHACAALAKGLPPYDSPSS